MNNLRIRRGSAWQQHGIEEFLLRNTIPLRLACNAGRGFPSLNSLWHEFRDGCLCCATHRNSAIIDFLRVDPRCAFEVAPNDPPYCGVRGQARAELQREGAAELLSRLIARYLGDSSPELAAWLLSRADEEYVVRLQPTWISAWDYRPRMTPGPAAS
jgi:hypothetical protein